ncbi:DUF2982 domain-containing protein [Shewanella sp. C32]|uniref:DUF2982 domain-containing protein n=1 Tax=Shewanella electrica TaxID=515560 RepID=A0ABT2FJP9_9GAMM|nr:DUF2982 domain-containing protein [Shewanella electrica]MCH1924653.1 DUF2982 domain-containing protein [Shewanella electrica]MCS4556554.1 DUF2982 domain-containing protein [Shewanella electrica]
MDTIELRSTSKRNALTLTVVGASALMIAIILFVADRSWFAVAFVAFMLGAVALIIGIAKQYEPAVVMTLSAEGLRFHHRRGSLFIEWQNIQRIDFPRVQRGLALVELPFIGVKLKAVNPILDNISPRLATGLLTEQRSLMMTAVANDEDLAALEHYLSAEFTPLVVNGDRYRGLLAMFGRRCLTLDKHLGYHLYLSAEFVELEPQQLLMQLRDYWQTHRFE